MLLKLQFISGILLILLLSNCSSDDSGSSSSSTSGTHSCAGEDPFVCTDLVAGADIAKALCQTTFTEGVACDTAAGTKGCKFEFNGDVEGHSIGWYEAGVESTITCGGEVVTKE